MHLLTDFHCHLLPYVDDGAQTLQEAQALLAAQCAQGVGTICLTPHWRVGMFETPHQKVLHQYERLRAYASTMPNAPTLRLGREYYCNDDFFKLLAAGQAHPLEGTQLMLIEFSPHRHDAQHICAGVQAVQDAGFIPMIAHVERYEAVRNDTALLREVSAMGAVCQMNAEGVLGKLGLREQWFCSRLLKNHAADIALMASDAHRLAHRSPNLGDCAARLQKKLPAAQWQDLFVNTPQRLLASSISPARCK